MLILLMSSLIIAAVFAVIAKRSKESLYLLGMCVSLAIQLSGILIYTAKKGGISRELQEFFFLSLTIKAKIQYFLITLDLLGYIIAIGRYLFPVFLLLLALKYTMIYWVRRIRWLNSVACILPILSLIIYYPKVFRMVTLNRPNLQQIIIDISGIWIRIYVFFAIILLLYELNSITLRFFKKQFVQILVFIISISAVYLLYCGQDPAQVYQFYSYDFIWKKGIYYMNTTLSVRTYWIIVVVNIICGILGFASFFKHTRENIEIYREESVIKNKFDNISVGASVFIHSIKNQLLANRVVHKRINQLYQNEEISLNQVKEYVDTLSAQNEVMLRRLDELYKTIKSNSLYLVPIELEHIIKGSVERFHNKYPDKQIHIEMGTYAVVLADQTHLCEAVYNLLTNAYEAIGESNRTEGGKISLLTHNERLYTVIEVRDNGIGIDESDKKKIFEPFYSSKNSNYNWGMGLYYVRAITKGHFGSLRYESIEGKGSNFYILLPKYKD